MAVTNLIELFFADNPLDKMDNQLYHATNFDFLVALALNKLKLLVLRLDLVGVWVYPPCFY